MPRATYWIVIMKITLTINDNLKSFDPNVDLHLLFNMLAEQAIVWGPFVNREVYDNKGRPIGRIIVEKDTP